MTNHNHRAGVPCKIDGCGDPQIGVGRSVDAILRTAQPGSTIARSYIVECLTLGHDAGPRSRTPSGRAVRQAKQKTTSSRGSRLAAKVARRIRTLTEAGAVQRVGDTHIHIVDMDLAPLWPEELNSEETR